MSESATPVEEFHMTEDDRLSLAKDVDEEMEERSDRDGSSPWKVVIVDDEEEVHVVTRLALDDFKFAGRRLEFVSAYSGAEAKRLIAENPDTAIILLDVVMETDEAGLDVAQYVRQELGNHFVRIILRTGQPGMAPERRVFKSYDINDYRAKTELTQERLFSVIYTALSSYRDLIALARSRHQLTGLVDELEQFAYIATQDLQRPLADLAGVVQLMQENSTEKLDEKGQQYVEKIRDHTRVLQGVVNDLVTLTKAGSYNEKRELTNCESLLEEAIENLQGVMDMSHVNLTHDRLPSVYACRRQILQLFENLISNAIKFQPNDRAEVHVGAASKGRSWLFSVADKGMGVSPEHHRSIFSVFQRGHLEEDHEGSGIGLAICEKVVRWHGGKIWVESQEGEGATFYFTLPFAE